MACFHFPNWTLTYLCDLLFGKWTVFLNLCRVGQKNTEHTSSCMCSGITHRVFRYASFVVHSTTLIVIVRALSLLPLVARWTNFDLFYGNCRSSTTPNTSDCVNQSQPFVNDVSYPIDRWWTGAVLAYAVVCQNSMRIPMTLLRPMCAALTPIRCQADRLSAHVYHHPPSIRPSIRGALRRV